MIDKDILDGLSELDEADLKRVKLLVDNKLNIESDVKVSYRTKSIKCGKESCNSCPHGPYWYAEWSENGKRNTKYLGKILNEMAADAFDKIKASHCRVDVSKHPAMHKTDSIDYIILLKGDVTLILDEDEIDLKPFDTVVQRGTNHAWRNNGNEPALFIAVLIDSEIDA
jgi:mannose-6-phosphate isomerase-like protein (cupin superfamily)